MRNISEIIDCQKKINELMLQYEEATRGLLSCDIDDVPSLIQKREDISLTVNELSDRVKRLCSEDETGKESEAFSNSCMRGDLPEELYPIFDLRQEFNSIGFRIKNMDSEAIERIKIEKEKLIEKIKKNNSGQNANAAKYFNSGMETGKEIYFPKKQKKI